MLLFARRFVTLPPMPKDAKTKLVSVHVKMTPELKAELDKAAETLSERQGRQVHGSEILRSGLRDRLKAIRAN